MRALILIAAFAIPAAAPAAAPAPPTAVKAIGPTQPICPTDLQVRPLKQGESARPERLGELPPGELIYAVWRSVDGCAKPVIVREERQRPGR